MTLGDALYVGGFIVLPIAIVSWCLSQLRRLRNRGAVREPPRSDSTAEFPAISGSDAGKDTSGEVASSPLDPPTELGPTTPGQEVSVRRDWAEAVRPTRGRQATPRTDTGTPQRPFSPPLYAGRSGGVVLRAVPPAKRWPLAHFKAPYAPTPRRSTGRRRPAG